MMKRFSNPAKRRQLSVRYKTKGSDTKPRLTVFRSNKYIYAQVINDVAGKTLAAAKGVDAAKVGEELAKKALKNKVTKVVFDRGPYRYHGRVQKLADGARKGGLKF
jgi:large subunit ribosomal protein L18